MPRDSRSSRKSVRCWRGITIRCESEQLWAADHEARNDVQDDHNHHTTSKIHRTPPIVRNERGKQRWTQQDATATPARGKSECQPSLPLEPLDDSRIARDKRRAHS